MTGQGVSDGGPALAPALFDEERIRRRVGELAAEVSAGAAHRPLVLLGVLRGSFIFLADLVRALHRRGTGVRIDFLTLASYGAGTTSSGEVRLARDFAQPVAGEDVLLVDDILDTGRTLHFARGHVLARGAARVRTCVLLDKPTRRVVPCEADFVGFRIDDVFVVGYGLDYDGRFRELPFLTTLAGG